jgi:hypothetical protein
MAAAAIDQRKRCGAEFNDGSDHTEEIDQASKGVTSPARALTREESGGAQRNALVRIRTAAIAPTPATRVRPALSGRTCPRTTRGRHKENCRREPRLSSAY